MQALFVVLVIGTFLAADYYQRANHITAVVAGVVVLAVVFGAILMRFTLGPTRKMQQLQKLFISNVAHELRTPLATIKTSSEVALLNETLPKQARLAFVDIIEELNRVSEIINNLLSLNTLIRPERIQFINVDLAPLAEEVIKKHQSMARERGIRLVLRQKVGAVAWGNSAAFIQIMTNLIKNALAYTPENTNGTVEVSLSPTKDDMVLFSVTDSGIGMTQEEIFHAFEPFYRGDTSRTRMARTRGSGLGLAIVSELVRTHRGTIQVESQRHKGTTVLVRLPQKDPAHRAASAGT
jgi:signal transduction histidine kinase